MKNYLAVCLHNVTKFFVHHFSFLSFPLYFFPKNNLKKWHLPVTFCIHNRQLIRDARNQLS